MDVLLLNLANFIDEQGQPRETPVSRVAASSLGVLYLGQVLHNNGYEVKTFDQNVSDTSNNELMKIIKKLDPRIVGFSMLIHNFWTTMDLLKQIKQWNPNIYTVAGNYFATFYPERVLNEMEMDFCIKGEGEYSLLELVNRLFKNKTNYGDINGLTYRENGIVKSTPPAALIKDIDQIPIPDRKLLDYNYKLQDELAIILSSRGCPFRCRFCYFNALLGTTWRARSEANVVEEIKQLKDQGFKRIHFVDANFTINRKRVFRLCAEIKRNKLDDLFYYGDSRVDRASKDLFRALVSINLKMTSLGLESGNQRILDYYTKGITLDQIKRAVKTANKAGIEYIVGSFILGAPDETFAEVLHTIKFAEKLDLSFVLYQILNIVPILPIYQDIVDKGYYTPVDDDWKRSLDVPDVVSTAVPKKVLLQLIEEVFTRFFNKRRITKYLFRTLRSDYYINAVIQLIRNIRQGGGY